MVVGIVVFALGVILTLAGYLGSANGGTYIAFVGAIIWGPVVAVRAAIRRRRAEDALMDEVVRTSELINFQRHRTAYLAYRAKEPGAF
jgi:hypothetical protein